MKKTYIFLLFIFIFHVSRAQDIIVKKDGSIIQAKVEKVGTSEVEYRNWSNQNGPIYSILKENILAINYQNGEKDTFVDEFNSKSVNTSNTSPQYIKGIPDENNQSVIDEHNPPVHFATSNSKDSWYFVPIMAMSDSSLVSTKDLEMRIIPMFVNFHRDWENGEYSKLGYTIQVTNKSDNIIYVDLANTFRIYTDGTSKNFYDSETTTITNGTNSGVGVNLGGAATILGAGLPLRLAASSVSIAGGRQSSISTTYTNQRILSIPPHSKKILFEYEEVRTNKSIVLPEYKILSDLEIYAFNFPSLKRGQLKEEEYISYSETETPYTAQYYITYSTSPDFLSYTHLYAKLYTRYIVGADISDFESNFWGNGITKKQKDIQKHITNFWTVDGACDIIIGREGYILKN